MTEEQGPTATSWAEVGEQFRALGESIAGALRATWEHEETRETVQELRTGLDGLARDVGQTIERFGQSSEGQRLRSEAVKATESARAAGEAAWQDAQPHILAALRQINAELQKVTSRLEQAHASDQPAAPEDVEAAAL